MFLLALYLVGCTLVCQGFDRCVEYSWLLVMFAGCERCCHSVKVARP